MTEKSLEIILHELGDGLNLAFDRIRELEGKVMGQQWALERCAHILALDSGEKREMLLIALDEVRELIMVEADGPEIDDVTASAMCTAAATVDELRRSLTEGPSASLTVIEGGRDDSSSDD